jgi:pyruvate formate lyase activating enzyme
VSVDLAACTACGACVDACPSKALDLLGRSMGVDEILGIVEQDGVFYARSGGGLTLSGGEPLLQADFAARLLEAAQGRGIDTAVETSGCVPWKNIEKVCPHLDQVFYDVKCRDPERHGEATGAGNERILENLRRLCAAFPELPVVVRTPIVPGFNDSPDEIRAICEFLRGLPRPVGYELLPYHRFGEPKYRKLGQEFPLPDVAPPTGERMAALERVVEEAWHRSSGEDDA